jgi:hypothetical protein
MDEKGFTIRCSRPTKLIITRGAYTCSQLISAQHNANREWVMLLAAIIAIGQKLSLALIYKGESYDLQSTWIEDVETKDQVYFASSNGRSSNNHSLEHT